MDEARKNTFAAAYRYYEKWHGKHLGKDPEQWVDVAHDAGVTCADLGNTPLALELIKAVYTALAKETFE